MAEIEEDSTYQVLGAYLDDPHAIVLIPSTVFDPRTITHESLHSLGYLHEDEEFIRCLD